MSDLGKNQQSWLKLFKTHNILWHLSQNDLFKIKSSQINICRESRLMTKFDNSRQLPPIFKQNKIALLPISRGEYALGRFKMFHEFEALPNKILSFSYQSNLETLDFDNITSEATAVNCAYISGILEHFLGEPLVPTVSGRMGSKVFNFDIKSNAGHAINIDVSKAQIEIDAGFETATSFILIEAKNFISEDFVIRQLYYPLRRWAGNLTKTVKTVYLTYTNGTFELREYGFENINCYNSIVLIKSERYSISHVQINVQLIEQLIQNTLIEPEPAIPFPQADSFERVINLCELLLINDFLSKTYITENYGFDTRQTDYYINAGRYLGLIEISNIDGQSSAYLSLKGKGIFKRPLSDRSLPLIEILLSKRTIREILILYFINAEMPSKHTVKQIMRKSHLYRVNSEVTYHRRASTITGWVDWIVSQIED